MDTRADWGVSADGRVGGGEGGGERRSGRSRSGGGARDCVTFAVGWGMATGPVGGVG